MRNAFFKSNQDLERVQVIWLKGTLCKIVKEYLTLVLFLAYT